MLCIVLAPMAKTELIKLRATPEEKADLEARGKQIGMNLSEFVRYRCFDGTGPREGLGNEGSAQPSLDSFGTPGDGSEVSGIAASTSSLGVDGGGGSPVESPKAPVPTASVNLEENTDTPSEPYPNDEADALIEQRVQRLKATQGGPEFRRRQTAIQQLRAEGQI